MGHWYCMAWISSLSMVSLPSGFRTRIWGSIWVSCWPGMVQCQHIWKKLLEKIYLKIYLGIYQHRFWPHIASIYCILFIKRFHFQICWQIFNGLVIMIRENQSKDIYPIDKPLEKWLPNNEYSITIWCSPYSSLIFWWLSIPWIQSEWINEFSTETEHVLNKIQKG